MHYRNFPTKLLPVFNYDFMSEQVMNFMSEQVVLSCLRKVYFRLAIHDCVSDDFVFLGIS